MAQAVFDDHPLDQYFREAGEVDFMPGISVEFAGEEVEQDTSIEDDNTVEYGDSESSFMTVLSNFLYSLMAQVAPKQQSAFAERFKYDVISSSLLATSLPLPHPHTPRMPRTPNFPGNLSVDHSVQHSRTASVERRDTSVALPDNQDNQTSHSLQNDYQSWITSIPFAMFVVFFSAGHFFLAFVALMAFFSLYIYATGSFVTHDMTPSLDSLNELISASDLWVSTVQEALMTLEKDEESITSPGSSSPSSSLRVAVNTALHTTQSQFDSIRQLLIAVTSPSELSMLSEMYAPPSPTKPTINLPPISQTATSAPTKSSTRPMSMMMTSSSNMAKTLPRQRRISAPPPLDSIPSTWNSYTNLANAGTPGMNILQRREKRRSDLSTLLQFSQSLSPSGSTSLPTTPSANHRVPILPQLIEEDHVPPSATDDQSFAQEQGKRPNLKSFRLSRHFGEERISEPVVRTAPQSPLSSPNPENDWSSNSRRRSVLAPLPSTSNTLTPSPRPIPHEPRSTGSRFTSLQTSKHPLSLTALTHAMNAAVSSKRYTCSHLLALRFEDENDEAYWEDVRSVMGLLTSSFVDISARLTEALDERERIRMQDENPSPESIAALVDSEGRPTHSRIGSLVSVENAEDDVAGISILKGIAEKNRKEKKIMKTMGQLVSFAPIPSHLAKFATHIDGIVNALNDAKEELELCVESLINSRQGEEPSSSSSSPANSNFDDPTDVHPSLQAYERLRRELGMALRECERGRERLLQITHPPRPPREDEDEVPGLILDQGEESDKRDSTSSIGSDCIASELNLNPVVAIVDESHGEFIDDASPHLLLSTSSKHLPPPGIEQVFEADIPSTEVGAFNRERSKLSRDERIKIAKKSRMSVPLHLDIDETRRKRTTSLQSLPSPSPSTRSERNGPSPEVVQELKDVLFKVSEMRRKMMRSSSTSTTSSSPGVGVTRGDGS